MVSKDMLKLGRVRSAIRELFEFGRKRAAIVGESCVYDFSIGNPSVPPPAALTGAMVDLLSTCDPSALHGYTSAPGANETRDAIAENLNRRYGTSFTRRNLYISCGAAAALTSVLRALTLGTLGILQTAAGHPVLADGGPVSIPPANEIAIAGDGTISIVPQGLGPATLANSGSVAGVSMLKSAPSGSR